MRTKPDLHGPCRGERTHIFIRIKTIFFVQIPSQRVVRRETHSPSLFTLLLFYSFTLLPFPMLTSAGPSSSPPSTTPYPTASYASSHHPPPISSPAPYAPMPESKPQPVDFRLPSHHISAPWLSNIHNQTTIIQNKILYLHCNKTIRHGTFRSNFSFDNACLDAFCYPW